MGSPIYSLINAQYTGELAHSTHAELAQWRATVPALAQLDTPDNLAELVTNDPDLILGRTVGSAPGRLEAGWRVAATTHGPGAPARGEESSDRE